jgi:FkbM family methyltransferase
MESIRLGSDYGGWNIPKGTISSDSVVYAAGIGTDISFDLELVSRFGCHVHAFDPTPKSIQWLEEQDLPDKFHYYPWGLADYNGEAQFHIPKNPTHISHSMIGSQVTTAETVTVQVWTIKKIVGKLGHDRLDLLKMDIEGAEYAVLSDLLSSDLRPTLLLVEFHHRFKSIKAKATQNTVEKLRAEGYRLYSISPSGEELCFIHRPTPPSRG